MATKTRQRGAGGRGHFSNYRGSHHPGYAPGAGLNFTEDSITYGLRQQYTNFEGNKNRRGRQERKEGGERTESEWAKVVRPMPEGLETQVVRVDEEKVTCFYGKFHWLSNFYKSRMFVDGNMYLSVEHYYQACKLYMLAGPFHSSQIRRMPDPGSVKVAARRILAAAKISREDIEEWKINEGPRILEYGMMHKFVQNPELRGKLLETGDGLLVHAFPGEKVFAAGMDEEKFLAWAKENTGLSLVVPTTLSSETIPYYPKFGDGKNLEGLICMRIRKHIEKFAEDINSRYQSAEKKKKEDDAEKEKLAKEGAGDAAKTGKEEEKKPEEKKPDYGSGSTVTDDDVIKEGMDSSLVAAIASLPLSVKYPPHAYKPPPPPGTRYRSREEGHVPSQEKELDKKKDGAKKSEVAKTMPSRGLDEGHTPISNQNKEKEKEKEKEKAEKDKETKDKDKKDKKDKTKKDKGKS